MKCQELVELVTEYLEDALSPEERNRFEEHLSGCHGCRGYMEQMRTTIKLSGKLTEKSLEGKPGKQLLTVFRDWKQNPD